MTLPINPNQTELGRVFISAVGGAHPSSPLDYKGFYSVDTLEVQYGGKTAQFTPVPGHRDALLTGSVGTEAALVTTSISSYFPIDESSAIYNLGKLRKTFDLQIHFGKCRNPADVNDFDRAIIIEDCEIESYQTTQLTTLDSDGREVIRESVDIVGRRIYEVSNVCMTSGPAVFGGELNDEIREIITSRLVSPGHVDDLIMAASPYDGVKGTGQIAWSLDGGTSWNLDDVTLNGDDATAIILLATQNYVVIFSEAAPTKKYYYLSKQDIKDWGNTDDPTWSSESGLTYTNVAGYYLDSHGWIFNSAGDVIRMVEGDPNGTYPFTLTDFDMTLDAGTINDVHMASKNVAIAVGNTQRVLFTLDGGDTWTSVVGATDHYLCCWAISRELMWLGDDAGNLKWRNPTRTGSTAWTTKNLPFTVTAVNDIFFTSRSIGFAAIACSAGAVARTIDGGYSWRLINTGAVTETYCVCTIPGLADRIFAGYNGGILESATC